jgi:hypothetical protein
MKKSGFDRADAHAESLRCLKMRAFLDGAHSKSALTDRIKFVYLGKQNIGHLPAFAKLFRILVRILKKVQ